MRPRQVRRVMRAVHLLAAIGSAFLVYAGPLVSANTARDVLAFAIVPALLVSGLVMWQQAALRKLLGRRSGRSARSPVVGGTQGRGAR